MEGEEAGAAEATHPTRRCSETKGPLGSLAGWPLRRTAGSDSGSVHPL